MVKSDVYSWLRLRTYQISVRLCITQPQAVVSKLRQENQPGLIDKAVHLGTIE
ncbi:MAG: hypothetical protein HWQ35_01765 [Nostoc sp. NMS1]|uniref:hypothetical protein n=1 Tax=unclassified Nostoc TaxID=2593658 RepID=UPI0025D5D573|nr:MULTISPECIES: hypothetical protein [unclassified Nostoc]MBN3905347.1 hypothetical protein [Nostoc sp. NMS1]MBN3989481.1 hypothetical protein [Nostoc sp. NMS2]